MFTSLEGHGNRFLSTGGDSGVLGWYCGYHCSSTIQFAYFTAGNIQQNFYSTVNFIPNLNQWHHFAFVRSGDIFSIFVNGSRLGGSFTITDIIQNSDVTLKIGMLRPENPNSFYGFIDELRISKGVARWTADFTPPNGSYDN